MTILSSSSPSSLPLQPATASSSLSQAKSTTKRDVLIPKERAKEAVDSLIQHYSQNIHNETLSIPSSSNNNGSEESENVSLEAPYFDSLLGRPRVISAMVQYWKDKLLPPSGQEDHDDDDANESNRAFAPSMYATRSETKKDNECKNDKDNTKINKDDEHKAPHPSCFAFSLETAVHVFARYTPAVRPVVVLTQQKYAKENDVAKQKDAYSSKHVALAQYEIFLSLLVENITIKQSHEQSSLASLEHSSSSLQKLLLHTTHYIFDDIFALTASPIFSGKNNDNDDDEVDKKGKENKNNKQQKDEKRKKRNETDRYMLQNIILPTLLRTLMHGIQLLHILRISSKQDKRVSLDEPSNVMIKEERAEMVGKETFHDFDQGSDVYDKKSKIANTKSSSLPLSLHREALAMALIVSLAFGTPPTDKSDIETDGTTKDYKENLSAATHNVKGTAKINASSLSSTALDPGIISHRHLNEDFTIDYILRNCAYPPLVQNCGVNEGRNNATDESKTKEALMELKTKPIIDAVLKAQTFGDPWVSSVSGIGRRSASCLFQAVVKEAISLNHLKEASFLHTIAIAQDPGEYIVSMEMVTRGIDGIGASLLARVARAHFFGRLLPPTYIEEGDGSKRNEGSAVINPDTDSIWTSPRTMAGRRILSPSLPSSYDRDNSNGASKIDCKAYDDIPARIHSTVRLLTLLHFPYVTSAVLSDILPIIYALIDSSKSVLQSFGGAALLQVLDQCTPTSFVEYHDTAVDVLTLACRICNRDEAATLAALSRSLARVFQIAKGRKDKSRAKRRAVTSDLLSLLKNVTYKGDAASIVALLVGGINPLLSQLASKASEAESMELCRMGLSALLPLIRWDGTDLQHRTVQISALVALCSLMMGAHPVMRHHGGKVMSELLSCVGRADRDLDIYDKMKAKMHQVRVNNKNKCSDGNDTGDDITCASCAERQQPKETDSNIESHAAKLIISTAIHVSSVALILCGDRAEKILQVVERGAYKPQLVKRCGDIRTAAILVVKHEKEKDGRIK